MCRIQLFIVRYLIFLLMLLLFLHRTSILCLAINVALINYVVEMYTKSVGWEKFWCGIAIAQNRYLYWAHYSFAISGEMDDHSIKMRHQWWKKGTVNMSHYELRKAKISKNRNLKTRYKKQLNFCKQFRIKMWKWVVIRLWFWLCRGSIW